MTVTKKGTGRDERGVSGGVTVSARLRSKSEEREEG